MKEVTDSTQMGELNNSIIALIGDSECNVLEVIAVLRIITSRLEKAFELQVMGNPVAGLAERLKHGSDVEKDSL